MSSSGLDVLGTTGHVLKLFFTVLNTAMQPPNPQFSSDMHVSTLPVVMLFGEFYSMALLLSRST